MLITAFGAVYACYWILSAEAWLDVLGWNRPYSNYTFPKPNVTRLYPKGFSISVNADDEKHLLACKVEFFAMDDFHNERQYIVGNLVREGDVFVYRFHDFIMSKHPHYYWMVYAFPGPNDTVEMETKDFFVWLD